MWPPALPVGEAGLLVGAERWHRPEAGGREPAQEDAGIGAKGLTMQWFVGGKECFESLWYYEDHKIVRQPKYQSCQLIQCPYYSRNALSLHYIDLAALLM